MDASSLPRAPVGDLARYERASFTHRGVSHDVYRRGHGPCVIVISEVPGIAKQLIGFADLVVAQGCSVALPHLFGPVDFDYIAMGAMRRQLLNMEVVSRLCISREFSMFVTGAESPVTDWLRALARAEHLRCGGPGVGAVGMCFTGGFALAMAADPSVIAPVLSQPSLPALPLAVQRYNIDCNATTLRKVATRCAAGQLDVVGLRFRGDPFVPKDRFRFLRDELGDAFTAIELDQEEGHPDGPLPYRHSVLTSDLIEDPAQHTYQARERVLELFRRKLLT